MKKVLFVVAIFALSTTGSIAQEIHESFENGSKGWWTPFKDIWLISTEKASDGNSSLKFSCTELNTEVKSIKFQNSGMKLSAGTYKITAKVFVEENSSISGFNIAILKPFTSFNFKLKKVTKGQWIEVEKDISLEKDASNVVINVPTNPKWGGTGTFYLDDLKFTKL